MTWHAIVPPPFSPRHPEVTILFSLPAGEARIDIDQQLVEGEPEVR